MANWSKSEYDKLLSGVGTYGWSWFSRNLERTKEAIYAKLQRSFSKGGITRGTYTLREMCSVTGYSKSQFSRAQGALGQKWHRTGRGGSYLITQEQMEEMTDWLMNDYWSKSRKLYACTECGESKRPHHAGGCCHRCYLKLRRRRKNADTVVE